jgi:hypothetical protein
MTTAIKTTICVPVRTWQQKAILTAAIAGGMPRNEGVPTSAGLIEELLLSDLRADECLDAHFEAWAHVERLQSALRALRAIKPGPGAWLEVAPELDVAACVGEQVDFMVETDVDQLRCKHPSKRDWAVAMA